MSELEEKLQSILSNPQMMQTIASMAQSLGQAPPEKAPETPPALPIDPGILQKIAGLIGQNHVDSRELALLQALGPYVHADRLGRLEKAMRSAKMAKLALGLLGSQEGTGR